jgi:cysteine desulfurase/selenocysteine lyase
MNDEVYVAELRQLFPVTHHWTYLYNGGIHPCPRPVGDAMRSFLNDWETGGRDAWPRAYEALGVLKEKFARLIDSEAGNIVITESTTAGINVAAQILRPDKDQNVVVTDLEFMSDTYPWLVCHPAEVRFAESRNGKIHAGDIAALIDERTAALIVSAVAAGSGFRVNLPELREVVERHTVPMIVDAAQALGVVDVSVKEAKASFLVCTASKWLMGPTGVGFLHVDDHYLDVTPPAVGWMAAENRNDWDLRRCQLYKDARRFQGGIPNLIGIVGALAGITLLEQIGREFIARRVHQLTSYAVECLEGIGVDIWTPRDPGERAGIVFFRVSGHQELFAKLKDARIYCGSFLDGIRIDPNFYNTFEEIDKFLGVVRTHVARIKDFT